jgi:hypothetical protein
MFSHSKPRKNPNSLIPQLNTELLRLTRSLILSTPNNNELARECASSYFKLARIIPDNYNKLTLKDEKPLQMDRKIVDLIENDLYSLLEGTEKDTSRKQRHLYFEQVHNII